VNTNQKRTNDFVKHVRRTAKLVNVRVVLRKQNKLFCNSNPKDKVNGYFSEPEGRRSGVITVAVNRPRSKWLGCLAHEFGHMCQWFFNQKVWYDCEIPRHGDATEIIQEWEQGEDYPNSVVERAFKAVRNLEQDADEKAMMYIEEWKLPVDLYTYQAESTNYDYSYSMMMKNRKWKYMRRK
jgi:hypothetical protein